MSASRPPEEKDVGVHGVHEKNIKRALPAVKVCRRARAKRKSALNSREVHFRNILLPGMVCRHFFPLQKKRFSEEKGHEVDFFQKVFLASLS